MPGAQDGRVHNRARTVRALRMFLALVCLACGPADETSRREVASSPPSREMNDIADSVRLTVEAPEQMRAGEPVPFVLRLRNTSGRALTLYLLGRTIAFDLTVERADGSTIWRRLEGEVIPSILRVEELPAGGELSFEHAWDQRSNAGRPVEPGEYRVRGELFTEGDSLVSDTVAFRILAY